MPPDATVGKAFTRIANLRFFDVRLFLGCRERAMGLSRRVCSSPAVDVFLHGGQPARTGRRHRSPDPHERFALVGRFPLLRFLLFYEAVICSFHLIVELLFLPVLDTGRDLFLAV
jgi:hypothetical protein